MKVLKEGILKIPADEPFYWVGKEMTCPSCGCQVKLEEEDGKKIYWMNVGLGWATFAGDCPTKGCETKLVTFFDIPPSLFDKAYNELTLL